MIDHMTPACEMPDGTQVEYNGEVFTALPIAKIGGAPIRWRAPNSLAGDRGMDGMLDDGATVIGRDDEMLAEYLKMTGGAR